VKHVEQNDHWNRDSQQPQKNVTGGSFFSRLNSSCWFSLLRADLGESSAAGRLGYIKIQHSEPDFRRIAAVSNRWPPTAAVLLSLQHRQEDLNGLRSDVDQCFRQLCQLLIRGAFFIQRLLQKSGPFGVAE